MEPAQLFLYQRIQEIVADRPTPERTISRIRWKAQEDPGLSSRLDIQARVRIGFQGMVKDSRIIGIRHDIGVDRWMVLLELAKS